MIPIILGMFVGLRDSIILSMIIWGLRYWKAMITVAFRLPYFVGIWYTFRNILQTLFVIQWGKNMVNCSLGFINFLKAMTVLLGYTGGRKTTENFCTWILFLTFSFIKNSRDYPFQNVFYLITKNKQMSVSLMMVKIGVI